MVNGIRTSNLNKGHDLKLNKHLKKAGGTIAQNIMNITIKMKTIVQKPWMIELVTFKSYNCV